MTSNEQESTVVKFPRNNVRELMRYARRLAQWHGHSLGRWRTNQGWPWMREAPCTRCRASAIVETKNLLAPEPISHGEALFKACGALNRRDRESFKAIGIEVVAMATKTSEQLRDELVDIRKNLLAGTITNSVARSLIKAAKAELQGVRRDIKVRAAERLHGEDRGDLTS